MGNRCLSYGGVADGLGHVVVMVVLMHSADSLSPQAQPLDHTHPTCTCRLLHRNAKRQTDDVGCRLSAC